MKKISIFLMVIVLSSVLGYAAVFNTVNDLEKVKVTMLNQEPDPVAPGNFVDVRFKIENLKTEALKNVEVKLDTRYPFSLYWSEDEIKDIGSLSASQYGDAGVTVKFRLLVDPDAAEGNNEIRFLYRVDGGAWIKSDEYTIEVRERDAVLAINEITTDCERMLPGNEACVKFKLDNMANSVLKDIKLKLDLFTSITSGATTTTTELPFTPIGSGNEKTVSIIKPGKSEEVSFDVFIDADAESKVYKVPYTLSYSDETGTNFSRTGYVGLMIDAEPDISITIDSTDIYSAGAKGTVTIKFVNKGFSDVKFLDVVLAKSDDYEILSNKEVYIGNIDSDDYESAEYELLISQDAPKKVILPLKVEYRNSNGKSYNTNVSLELPLFTGNELKNRAGQGGNPIIGILIVIVIIVVGFLLWRRSKKKKQKKQ